MATAGSTHVIAGTGGVAAEEAASIAHHSTGARASIGTGWGKVDRILMILAIMASIAWVVGIYLLPQPDGAHPRQPSAAEPDSPFQHWTWLIGVVILTVFLVGAGHAATGSWKALLIDERKKVSLSRLQLVLWTMLVLSTFATAVFWGLAQCAEDKSGSCNALSLEIPTDLLLLMGISGGALIGSKLIKTNQVHRHKLHLNHHHSQSHWSDILKTEGQPDNPDDPPALDLGKIQMLLFTVVLVLGYAAAIQHEFSNEAGFTFPELSAAMVGLLGISQIAYLSTKAAQNPPSGQSASSGEKPFADKES